ncbi:MAG: HEAT repeat domain-containing protein, partial [Candidatus Omnitrophica bacterium]|nr:HEAT repeat domain-containing protein [Candidatus Omnitrophota bacterium]
VDKVQDARIALEERLLEDENDLVREAAARSLFWLENPESIKAMTSALKDKNWRVREKAVVTLGKIGGKDEIPHLEKLLNDPEPQVVDKVKESIEKIKKEWHI